MDTITIEHANYNSEDLSGIVIDTVILAAKIALRERGMSLMELEQDIIRVVSDLVDVDDDGYAGITRVTVKPEEA